MSKNFTKKFTKEYKIQQIQKNISRKSRLRKEYLKVLKEEGYEVPEKTSTKPHITSRELKNQKTIEGRQKREDIKQAKRDRKRTLKEKLESRKQEEIAKIEDSKKMMMERERKKRKLTQKTRAGQPVFAPKIEHLLNKIQSDETYTK